MSPSVDELCQVFDKQFYQQFNTRVVKGNDEPIYLPADMTDIGIAAKPYAQIVFAHGYFTSALHEIAHWCLAGEARRKQIDYGYWYCPDGRTQAQQQAFEKVEIKPQAIEWALSLAAGIKFNVSCDNLSGDEFGNLPNAAKFKQAIYHQVASYLENGFPQRARQFMDCLSKHYKTPKVTTISQFHLEQTESSLCQLAQTA